MKKVLLYLIMFALVCQGELFAGNKSNDVTKEEKKQMRRVKKDRKSVQRAERKLKRSVRKEMRSQKKSIKKSEKKSKKLQKHADRDEKRAAKSQAAQEKVEMRNAKKAEKREARAERREIKKETSLTNKEKCLERCRLGREATAHRQREKERKMHIDRLMRKEMMESWDAQRQEAVAHDSLAGCYASQYKLPAWPVQARFSERKYLMQVGAGYRYATDGYDNTGTNHDITKNYFGSDQIRVKDVLLASKLVQVGTLTQSDLGAGDASKYLNYLADEVIKFNGRFEEYGTTFDLARYVKGRDFMIGIQIPFLYRKHHLKADLTPSTAAALNVGQGLAGLDGTSPNAFMRRYGQDTNLFIKDILRSKGINELGGSAAGLGDITLFMHGELSSAYFDRMIIGVRALVPTAKEASQAKLWAPDLGKNGGLNEFAVFASTMLAYSRCINPHIFIETFFSLPGHLNRRVPSLVNSKSGAATSTDVVGKDVMTFGDRVKYNNKAFSEFDTPLKNIGDRVASAKVTRGAGIELKVGNLFQRVLARKGSLDVYYQFKAKWRDHFSNLSGQNWNTDIFKCHSQSLQHNTGFEYNYQFDHDVRLSTGMIYTFSGMNTEKMFDVHAVVGTSF